MSDSNLHESLRECLLAFPDLRSMLPPSWPEHPKHEITLKKMEWYDKHRMDEHWQHMNLPMLLHNIAFCDDAKTKSIFHSMGTHFDRFAQQFGQLPRAQRMLTPLWRNAWQLGNPCFWSVASEVMTTNLIADRGHKVLEFEAPVGPGPTTADIAVQMNGVRTLFDVEAQFLTKTIAGGQDMFRKFIKGRANKKITDKFDKLPSGENGVAVLVFLPGLDNIDRFLEQRDAAVSLAVTQTDPATPPNKFAATFWLVAAQAQQSWELRLIHRLVPTVSADPA